MDTLLTDRSEPSAKPDGPRGRGHFLSQLCFVLFCLEVGFVLLLLPWTIFWDSNYFFLITPDLNGVWLSAYLRGAVSGVGLVNLWIGLGEAWRMKRPGGRRPA